MTSTIPVLPLENERTRAAWLLGTGAVPSLNPPAPEELSALCEFVCRQWQIAPMTVPRLLSATRIDLVKSPELDRLVDLARSVEALAAIQTKLLLRYARALHEKRVSYVLLKGSAMRFLVYDRYTDRGGMDLDVGVAKRSLDAAEDVLVGLGFMAASLDDSGRHFFPVDEETRSTFEPQHYELACFVRHQSITGLDAEVEGSIRRSLDLVKPWHELPDGSLGCYVTIDVHHGLCLDIPVSPSLATRQTIEHDGWIATAPSFAWLLLHLVFKIYWEGVHNYRKGLYQYADVCRLVPKMSEDDQYDFIEIAAEYELEAAAHYVLRRLPPHFGTPLPEVLQRFVAEQATPPDDGFPDELNDAGDMWPKIWGFR